MEELVRMLIDDGVIDAAQQPWRLDEARLEASRVPGTLVGVLQARLDALPAHELAALQRASIVGTVFWDAALAALDPAAPAALPDLRRREVVVDRESSAIDGVAELSFQHPLLHDVTYGTVLGIDRRAGHARAARWLAERMGDRASEFLAVAAEHFERAGDSAMALEYYERARTEAWSRFAYEATLSLIERALAQPALTSPRWRLTLLTARCNVFELTGRHAEGAAALQAIVAWAEACDDDGMRADVAVSRMLRADHDGHPDEARALAEQALALVARCPTAHVAGAAALAHGELAWLALERQDFDAVRRHLALAIDQARLAATVPAREGGYEGYELQLRVIEIEACQRQEQPLQALQAATAALQAIDGMKRPFVHDRVHLTLQQATAGRQLGDLGMARTQAQAALALAERMQAPRLVVTALLNLAETALEAGAWEEAAACAARVEGLSAEAAQVYSRPWVPRLRAELAEAHGDAAAAAAAWEESAAQLEAQERVSEALQARARAAAQRHAAGRDSRDAVHALLAAEPAGRPPHWPGLQPAALRACHAVLAAVADPMAAAVWSVLQARLARQLAQLPGDDPRRAQLLHSRTWRGVSLGA
jgi:hypothetical protein